jgi:RNA polymerase sigma factor (sigma-70 family)
MNINNNQKISDNELLNECFKGSEQAWEIFHERFSRLITATITRTARVHRMNLTPEDLRDCEQTIWASLLEKDYKKLRSYRGANGCTLATWLRTCTINMTINFLVSLNRMTYRHLPMGDTMCTGNQKKSNPEKDIEKHEILEKVVKIIQNDLSSRERLLASLYWFDEIPFDEISRIMNQSVDNLYVIKYRIQKKVQHIFEKSFRSEKIGKLKEK